MDTVDEHDDEVFADSMRAICGGSPGDGWQVPAKAVEAVQADRMGLFWISQKMTAIFSSSRTRQQGTKPL